jgi:hypothetical protein
VRRGIFLAAAALLAMLILAPMAMGQETTVFGTPQACGGGGGIPSGGGPAALPPSGGSAFLLPMAALLLGSGILSYAVLRRR